MKRSVKRLIPILFLVAATFGAAYPTLAQDADKKAKLSNDAKIARDQSLGILTEMEEILREYYYDPKFHGVDLKARIEAAKTRVKTLEYNWQMHRVLVQVLMEFNDSHTRMLLPPRTDYFTYGLTWQMVGNDCFVTSVKTDSDAAKKGIEKGDQILLIGKFAPSRNDLWKINFLIYKLDPLKTLDLKIRKPDGTESALTIEAKTMTDKEYMAERKAKKDKKKEKYEPFKCLEVNKDLVACRLDTFIVEKSDIDKMMATASKYPKLILDLRGNGGGYVAIEQYLLGFFFDHEIKIADMITKDKTDTRLTKMIDAGKQYKGEVSVLVDSNSASAAEMTAKVLQLEKRAKVYGDYSSGSVMTSITVPFRSVMSLLSAAAMIRVGMSVTIADVVMRDGSRLEHVGVTPDQVLQPTGVAFKNKMDAVLAYAAVMMGAEMTPEQAGKFHFILEKDEDSDDDES